jgi:hypothetical protein
MIRFLGWAPVRCLALALAVQGCVSVESSSWPTTEAPSAVALSEADAAAIGRKIWQNECAGTVEGLTSWNAGEDFPSLGIGHFIWYVPGRPGPFEESFPPLIAYMKERNVAVPGWLAEAKGCPWTSRQQFLNEQQSPRMKELRQFLANTVPVQTGFIVRRLERSLPQMEQATPDPAGRGRLRENFQLMASSRSGLYALIDYVNFKGEGIKPEERYQGQGWGLRDVLLEMKPVGGGAAATAEFSAAAKRVLERRVNNSPPERGESRWLAGWMNRCETYKRGI